MPRNITVTFADGTQHIYENAPDSITPDAALARARQDFAGKEISNIDGGRSSALKMSRSQQLRADVAKASPFLALPSEAIGEGLTELGLGATELAGRGLRAVGLDKPGNAMVNFAQTNRTSTPAAQAVKEAYPNAFAATKLGSQIYATAPVGGLLAKPVYAAAKAAPALLSVAKAIETAPLGNLLAKPVYAAAKAAPALLPVASAIETAGGKIIPTGSKLANAALRAAGGAAVGGASAALINPDDAGTGAAIGAVVPTVVAPVLKKVVGGIGTIADYVRGRVSDVRAGEMLREAFGGDVDNIIQILKTAPDEQTARQAMVDLGVDADTVFALGQQIEKRNLSGMFSRMAEAADKARKSMMDMVAGGETQEAARVARESAKDLLTEQTTPMREQALAAAQATNEVIPALRQQVSQFGDEAAQQVENVRRFTRAGEKAAEAADPFYSVPGMPRTAGKYTYMGELPAQAEQRAANAAEQSLEAGAQARTAAERLATLEAQGLKPIDGEKFSRVIAAKLNDPNVGTNEDVRRALVKISKEINRWINEHGVVDADALYGIRKNAVNAVIERLSAGRDPTAQKRFASQVISQINPIIDDTIEQAGGKGWRSYLNTFSKGMQEIDRMELVAKAQQLYDQDPKAFLKLARGNNPQEVEKILGSGSFEIAQEIAGVGKLSVLNRVAKELSRDEQVALNAAAGAGRLEELINKNKSIRLNLLNRWVYAGNEAMDILERNVSAKERMTLDKAFQSGKNMAEALEVLPTARQAKLLSIFYTKQATPAMVRSAAISAAQPNTMAPPVDNRNAMAR